MCPVESEGCGNTSVHRLSPVDLPQEYEFLNQSCDPKEIERGTRDQADSQLWMKEKRNRLTASNFGKVLQRKSTPNEKFLSKIFRPKSLEYGKRNEENAKAKYLKQHPSRHFHKCGLVINEKFTFLGARQDGKLCDDGVCGIVEIKCPFSARNFTICQSLDAIQNFCLEKNNDGTIQLKRSHQYYVQIQGQLMITGCEFCEFIVFTQKDLFVERILPDVTFMNAMLVKLASFFKNHAKPLLDRNSSESMI
ncbi:hypothetical protein FSP39_002901 [Pinctada imbricata]|uniref:YqaJ viral recombinase domain-containing protein n=1 Tax=Pinctada imbricata TaxID=66713 RepID=A0AA88YKW3_PINIB|nr:hypothetical protein FSP39_002901 [Pinctada imbricata]